MKTKRFLACLLLLANLCLILSGCSGYHYRAVADNKLFHDGLIPVKYGGKWGYIDKNENEVISFFYDYAEPFHNGRGIVTLGSSVYLIDKNGKRSDQGYSSLRYDENEKLYIFSQNNKYGTLDKKGEIIVEALYDEIGSYRCGLAYVKLNGKYGFIDTDGKQVVTPQYDEVSGFSGNACAVCSNGKYGLIGKNGDVIVEAAYDDASTYLLDGLDMKDRKEAIFLFELNGKSTAINQKGEKLFTETEKEKIIFSGSALLFCTYNTDTKLGTVRDAAGEILLEEQKLFFDIGALGLGLIIGVTSPTEEQINDMLAGRGTDYEGAASLSFYDLSGNFLFDGKEIGLGNDYEFENFALDICHTKDFYFVTSHSGNYYHYYHNGKELKKLDIPQKTCLSLPIVVDGHFIVYDEKTDRTGVMNKKGETVLDTLYDSVDGIYDDGYIIYSLNGLYGVKNFKGKQVIGAVYEDIGG